MCIRDSTHTLHYTTLHYTTLHYTRRHARRHAGTHARTHARTHTHTRDDCTWRTWPVHKRRDDVVCEYFMRGLERARGNMRTCFLRRHRDVFSPPVSMSSALVPCPLNVIFVSRVCCVQFFGRNDVILRVHLYVCTDVCVGCLLYTSPSPRDFG